MGIYGLRTNFGKHFKWILIIIAGIFLVGAIYSFGTAPGGSMRDEQGGDVVAKVNGAEISRGEFEAMWNRSIEDAKNRGIRSPLQYADMRAMIVQQLVRSRVMLDAARDEGVDVSDRRVNEEVDKLVTTYLNQNRQVVLGKLSKRQLAMDPRDDRNYRDALASIDSSISQQEDFARSRIPVDQVRSQLAQMGIEEKLRAGIERVTDRDVMASYNAYKIRQIGLAKGKLPEQQLAAKAAKIIAEAKRGADFGTLARQNSDAPDKKTGGQGVYSFETRFMFAPQVREAVERMKPGQVSPVIDAGGALFIVKLEGVSSRLPAKLDAKAESLRRQQLRQEREANARMAFEISLGRKQKVEIVDPELLAYWQLAQAQQTASDQMAYRKLRSMAVASLKRAIGERPNNSFAAARLARLLMEDGKYKDATTLLYPMLEGKNASIEGADLRMMLGEMLEKQGKPKETARAMEQYRVASEVARNDPAIHQQLIAAYQRLKRPELVAAEQKWLTDYAKRMEQLKAMGKDVPGGGRAPRP